MTSPLAEPIDLDESGELDAQEATSSFDCKRPNCPREARKGRGRYAFLCDVHIEEAKSGERDDAGRSIFRGGIARPPTLVGVPERQDEPEPEPEVVEDPPAVSEAHRDAEEPFSEPSLAWRRLCRDEAEEAVAEFNEALKAIRDAASAILAAA